MDPPSLTPWPCWTGKGTSTGSLAAPPPPPPCCPPETQEAPLQAEGGRQPGLEGTHLSSFACKRPGEKLLLPAAAHPPLRAAGGAAGSSTCFTHSPAFGSLRVTCVLSRRAVCGRKAGRRAATASAGPRPGREQELQPPPHRGPGPSARLGRQQEGRRFPGAGGETALPQHPSARRRFHSDASLHLFNNSSGQRKGAPLRRGQARGPSSLCPTRPQG